MINIVYSCDNDFLDWVGISIASVIYNNPEDEITFHISTESPNSEKLERLKNFYFNNKNVVIKHIDCTRYDSFLEENKCDKWGSKSFYTYWQLFAFDLLDCECAWYLDSDIICLGKIVNPKLEKDKCIGGVLDTAHALYSKTIGLKKNEYYYNAGAFFVDIKKWKEMQCTQKCLDYIKNVRSNFTMADQDLFSLSLQKETQLISPKYDYLAGYDYYGIENSFKIYSLNKKPFYNPEEIEKAKNEIIFYHCLGGVFGRPWEDNNEHPLKNEYHFYTEMSAFNGYRKKWHQSTLVKIQKATEFLPDCIYCSIHNIAQICMVLYNKARTR